MRKPAGRSPSQGRAPTGGAGRPWCRPASRRRCRETRRPWRRGHRQCRPDRWTAPNSWRRSPGDRRARRRAPPRPKKRRWPHPKEGQWPRPPEESPAGPPAPSRSIASDACFRSRQGSSFSSRNLPNSRADSKGQMAARASLFGDAAGCFGAGGFCPACRK